jgi:hypothetical protein
MKVVDLCHFKLFTPNIYFELRNFKLVKVFLKLHVEIFVGKTYL